MTKTMEMEKVCGVHQADLPVPPTPPPKPTPKLNLPKPERSSELVLPGVIPRTDYITEAEVIEMLERQVSEQAEMIVKLSKSALKKSSKYHILKSRCEYLEQTLIELSDQAQVYIPMPE